MLSPVDEGTEVTGTAAAVGEREGHCEVSLEPHGNMAVGTVGSRRSDQGMMFQGEDA